MGITPKLKKLTTEQKEMLITSGRESAEKYFREKEKMNLSSDEETD